MATHSSTHAWIIPQTEEPGGLQPMGSRRVGHGLVTKPPPQDPSGPFRVQSPSVSPDSCLWKEGLVS